MKLSSKCARTNVTSSGPFSNFELKLNQYLIEERSTIEAINEIEMKID